MSTSRARVTPQTCPPLGPHICSMCAKTLPENKPTLSEPSACLSQAQAPQHGTPTHNCGVRVPSFCRWSKRGKLSGLLKVADVGQTPRLSRFQVSLPLTLDSHTTARLSCHYHWEFWANDFCFLFNKIFRNLYKVGGHLRLQDQLGESPPLAYVVKNWGPNLWIYRNLAGFME